MSNPVTHTYILAIDRESIEHAALNMDVYLAVCDHLNGFRQEECILRDSRGVIYRRTVPRKVLCSVELRDEDLPEDLFFDGL